MTTVRKESELYEPVAKYFRAQGYQVKAEIKDCDVLAIKADEEPIIIELKRSFSIQLLIQAVKRKKITGRVIVAVPSPKSLKRARDWRLICEEMGVGMILIKRNQVEICTFPADVKLKRANRKKTALLTEFHTRKNDQNIGGTTGVKRFTAYREQAVQLARAFAEHPNQYATAREIRQMTNVAKTARMIRDNVYGWFERVDNDLNDSKMPTYRLSEQGTKEWHGWQSE